MSIPNSLIIKCNKLMVVEGFDEEKFFGTLLNKLNITDIQVIQHGGKEKFKHFLPLLVNTSGFNKVSTLVVIRDADQSVEAALQSIQACLTKHSLPSPKENGAFVEQKNLKVGVFVLPGNKDFGMLENLVLDSINNCDVIDESNAYIDGLIQKLTAKNKQDKIPSNQHKARMHAYFAGKPKYVQNIGIAAEKGYIDFTSPVFTPLKTFLQTV